MGSWRLLFRYHRKFWEARQIWQGVISCQHSLKWWYMKLQRWHLCCSGDPRNLEMWETWNVCWRKALGSKRSQSKRTSMWTMAIKTIGMGLPMYFGAHISPLHAFDAGQGAMGFNIYSAEFWTSFCLSPFHSSIWMGMVTWGHYILPFEFYRGSQPRVCLESLGWLVETLGRELVVHRCIQKSCTILDKLMTLLLSLFWD